jgi:hypothetical protein
VLASARRSFVLLQAAFQTVEPVNPKRLEGAGAFVRSDRAIRRTVMPINEVVVGQRQNRKTLDVRHFARGIVTGGLNWEKANREARARKNGTLSIYPETRTRKRKPKRRRVKRSTPNSARALDQLRRLLRIVGTSKWEENGASYQQELARQMRAMSEKVVRLKPAFSRDADVLRAREVSRLLFDGSGMSVDVAIEDQQKRSPAPCGEGQEGFPVAQIAEPKDEKMVRYLAAIIAKREGVPLERAMLFAAAEQVQKEEELKIAKKRARKGAYGAKGPGALKKARSSQRTVYATPGDVRLVSGGLPSLGKQK